MGVERPSNFLKIMKKFLIFLFISLLSIGTVKASNGISVVITVYHPTKKQCQGDPSTTASGKRIPIQGVKNGTVRWIALSRDLLRKFTPGAPFDYGDVVTITCGDPRIDGDYIVQDTMAKRMRKHVDILTWSTRINTGTWNGKIKLKKKGT